MRSSLGPTQHQVPTGCRPRAGSEGAASVFCSLDWELRVGRRGDADGWALRLRLETGCIVNYDLWGQGWGSRAGQLSNWAVSRRAKAYGVCSREEGLGSQSLCSSPGAMDSLEEPPLLPSEWTLS